MRYFDDTLDDEVLLARTGLSRQEAHDLLLSYAYAENGQHLRRLGNEALGMLIGTNIRS